MKRKFNPLYGYFGYSVPDLYMGPERHSIAASVYFSAPGICAKTLKQCDPFRLPSLRTELRKLAMLFPVTSAQFALGF